MGRISREKAEEVLEGYFGRGMEPEEIAREIGLPVAAVNSVLGNQALLAPYHRRSEAAKLRAQICVNESAEEAARRQAALLRADEDEKARAMSQRAAKDILDRAGVRMPKENRTDVTITFRGGMPPLGMPEGRDGN